MKQVLECTATSSQKTFLFHIDCLSTPMIGDHPTRIEKTAKCHAQRLFDRYPDPGSLFRGCVELEAVL